MTFIYTNLRVHADLALLPGEYLKIGHVRDLLGIGRVHITAQLTTLQIPGAFTSALSLIGHTDRCESHVLCLTSHLVQIPVLVMLV